jgi:hypothetical protein
MSREGEDRLSVLRSDMIGVSDAIGALVRAMPRNQGVIAMAAAVDQLRAGSKALDRAQATVLDGNVRKSNAGRKKSGKPFDKRAWQRQYMRDRRAKARLAATEAQNANRKPEGGKRRAKA